jgi:hypothetical protein
MPRMKENGLIIATILFMFIFIRLTCHFINKKPNFSFDSYGIHCKQRLESTVSLCRTVVALSHIHRRYNRLIERNGYV